MAISVTGVLRTTYVLALMCLAGSAQDESRTSPAGDSSVAASYAAADVVFEGFLENLTDVPQGYKAEFKVDTPIKNVKASKVFAFSAKDSRCGHLENLKSYLVYAQNVSGALWVDLCNGTKHRSLSEADLKYIHTLNPKVGPECSRTRLEKLSKRSDLVLLAEVSGTKENNFFSCWSGLARCVQDERYKVVQVFKGYVDEPEIIVEHVIVDNSLTADVDVPQFSPSLFREGNRVVLFLWHSATAPYGDARQRAADGVGLPMSMRIAELFP